MLSSTNIVALGQFLGGTAFPLKGVARTRLRHAQGHLPTHIDEHRETIFLKTYIRHRDQVVIVLLLPVLQEEAQRPIPNQRLDARIHHDPSSVDFFIALQASLVLQ